MTPSTPRQKALVVLAALLAIDLALTLSIYASGSVHAGKATILDSWDVVKAIITAGLLFRTASLTGSKGIGMFGVVFVVIGLVDVTSFHALLARPLAALVPLDEIFGVHPTSAEGVGELIVLTIIGALLFAGIVIFRDLGDEGRVARWIFITMLVALMLFAGVIDVVDDLHGIGTIWSVIEEIGERLVFTASTAFSFYLWARDRTARAPSERSAIS